MDLLLLFFDFFSLLFLYRMALCEKSIDGQAALIVFYE
jgi:hypothetical protein